MRQSALPGQFHSKPVCKFFRIQRSVNKSAQETGKSLLCVQFDLGVSEMHRPISWKLPGLHLSGLYIPHLEPSTADDEKRKIEAEQDE